MKRLPYRFVVLTTVLLFAIRAVEAQTARNPIIFADVPDMAMIRVGDT